MSKVDVQAMPLAEMRTHRSTKWRDFPSDVLPLPVAEMDFPVAQPIRTLLLEMVSHSDLGYLGAVPELGAAFAAFAHRRWNWTVDPNQIHIATDVGVAAVELLRLVTKPGDKVLINSPVYHNFYTWIEETQLKKVDVPFGNAESGWAIDFEGIEKAYQDGVKVHMLCSPHNPLGRVYSREELLRLVSLAKKFDVLIISDEIHAPLTFSESEFVPFLSLGEDAESVGITITAASKAWNIAGLKCAFIVTQSPIMSATLQNLPEATHYRASLLGAFATTTAFSECDDWLDGAIETLDSNRHFLKKLLDEKLPTVGYRIPASGYLAWLDLSSLNLGENPAATCLEKGKVAFNSGESFSSLTPQYVRLNFATSQDVLTEAVERIIKSL
ncbi:unannotated protein [freshwater metagenome]|uniref:cysteine-S-conjugate beta-lyase n=1 Tax=freshwater metagenome TaxID=449393 RepID=A0A6J6UYE9_9ZZZZ|nr:aminotransferase class I/II-fold pyridoxal phosphate-dependent enzyme [Actinomycetota bacterium]MSW57991.1 aminotransferase class I/II-fold pyridoxal phosphate-dependent enzyme [Actinomycetota bacterium]MSX48571.1 aminotransferase class I/II-fold pyridoxal phosphate-dependent enzyme [Actinomycetota bacterium]MSY09145.1 aminotransferase class I/II-fold pyridoxal phosphate-dependent enzyme [Actinomycetota bacterium]MTA67617.1 aminotransferase class I/II-fold pyridoxal phosphate-dependent enzym